MPHTQAHRTHSTPCIHRHLAFTPHMDLHGPHAHHLPGNEPSFLFGEETITLGLQCITENPQSFHFLFSCRGWQPWGLNSEVLTAASPDVQAPTCSHLCISVPPPPFIPSCLHTCPSPQNIPPGGGSPDHCLPAQPLRETFKH